MIHGYIGNASQSNCIARPEHDAPSQAAKTLHPDSTGRAVDKEAFIQLLAAYETLGNAQQRRLYDLNLDERSPSFIRRAAQQQAGNSPGGESTSATGQSARAQRRQPGYGATGGGPFDSWRWGAGGWAGLGPDRQQQSELQGSSLCCCRVASFLSNYKNELEIELYEALVHAYLGPK